ncbi:MAG: sialidase family protein, partial [Limisphaerales bacterium]
MALAGFFLLAFISTAISQPDSVYTFFPDVKITESGEYDGTSFDFFSPRYTAYRGDTVYVIWQEDRFNPSGRWILFAKSTDRGNTFGPNVIAAGGLYPAMCVDNNGIIYFAYQNSGDIFFRKSTNGGASFSARVRVTDDTLSPAGQNDPSIAVNNKGQIFVTWVDYRTNPYSAFASASYDGGVTFTPNVQANALGTRGAPGDIAADDSGRVYVFYGGTLEGRSGIITALSNDSGQGFYFHTLVSDTPWSTGSLSGAVSPLGLVGVAWTGSRVVNGFLNSILHFSVSFDRGQMFSPSVRVDDDSDLSTRTAPH